MQVEEKKKKKRSVKFFPFGAVVTAGGVLFRVWAPKACTVEVVLEGPSEKIISLEPEEEGFFSAEVSGVNAGSLYRYRLDHDQKFPDPCSRFQPQGPHGPSRIVDAETFQWTDQNWRGIELQGQIIYELHIGSFTSEGTFDRAIQEFAELKRIGIGVIEVMPVAECPGRWNWGYDGVNLFAPNHHYGDPEAFKRFVDVAHREGLAVILDVVYNHLGPDGNYLDFYSSDFFTDRYQTDWGKAINYDGPGSHDVREFFLENACYWIREFHLDGLRLDATQNIYDSSRRHFLAELSERTRKAAGARQIILIAEDEMQRTQLVTVREQGGYGLDAICMDDFHHTAKVALTRRHEAYFNDYRGTAQELISCIQRGSIYQGQYSEWHKKRWGTQVKKETAQSFVFYLQNHDQVGNSVLGERIPAGVAPERWRALVALLLLSPETPLIFMGQEFGASSPFPFFAEHNPQLAPLVFEGRKKFLAKFPSYATPEAQQKIPNPAAKAAFLKTKLNFEERESHAQTYLFYQDLIRLRKTDPVISAQKRENIAGTVLRPEALVLRYFGQANGDRLLVVNLEDGFDFRPAPEPLLAPPSGFDWQLVWTTCDSRYGGTGIKDWDFENWKIPSACALFFSSNKNG